MRYLTLNEVLDLYQQVMEQSGGAVGIRDLNALESAVAQPRMTLGGEELYPTVKEKASALGFSLVMNHPFVDGNKRTGAAAAELFVEMNGHDLNAIDSELEHLTMATARGEMSAEALSIWFRQRLLARQV